MLYVYDVTGDIVTVLDTNDGVKEKITAQSLLQIVSKGITVVGVENGKIVAQDTYCIGNKGYKINREGFLVYSNSVPIGSDIISLTMGFAPNFTFNENFYGDNKIFIQVDNKISNSVVQSIVQFPNTHLTRTNKGYIALEIHSNANPQHVDAIYNSPYFLETYTVYADCDKVRMYDNVVKKILKTGATANFLSLINRTECEFWLYNRSHTMDIFCQYLRFNIVDDFKFKFKTGTLYDCDILADCINDIYVVDDMENAVNKYLQVLPNLGLPQEVVNFFPVALQLSVSKSPYRGTITDSFKILFSKTLAAYASIRKLEETTQGFDINLIKDVLI